MKKIFLALLGLMTVHTANADQIVCRGVETTMKITDYADGDDNFVVVEVWNAQYDGARYADLFQASLSTSAVPNVEALKTRKSFSTMSLDGRSALQFNFEKGALAIKYKDRSSVTDKLLCKTTKQPALAADSSGGE